MSINNCEGQASSSTHTSEGIQDHILSNSDSQLILKTPIWKFFTRVDKDNAKCTHCDGVIKTLYGNTTSMQRHLKKHPNLEKQFMELQTMKKEASVKKTMKDKEGNQPHKKQMTMKRFTGTQKWPSTHSKAEKLTNKIGKWIAQHSHPFSVVEEEGFIALIEEAQPQYTVPSRQTFSRRVIPAMYMSMKEDILSKILSEKDNLMSLSVTSDMWSSRSNISFLSLTCHYMTGKFEMRCYCLGCKHFVGSHTGDAICQCVQSILEDYQLSQLEIPVYCITDNAANMCSAMRKAEQLTGMRCFAHTLQLTISDAKKATTGAPQVLAKARQIVGHYKSSDVASENLRKQQTECGMSSTLEIIQDVETRWNSEYAMLHRLLQLKLPLSIELVKSNCENLLPNDWELIAGYVEVLKPLDEATRDVSTDHLPPTASMVIPILYGLTSFLEDYVNGLCAQKSAKTFAKNLYAAIKSRFPMFENMEPHCYCTVMDPRFKDCVLTQARKEIVKKNLKKELGPSENTVKDTPSTSDGQSSFQSSSIWSRVQKASSETRLSGGYVLNASPCEQLDSYLAEPLLQQDENPCKWWADNIVRFPALRNLVLKYLPIPASQVASERVFSTAGNVCTSRRESQLDEHVEELVMLCQNLTKGMQ